jgi:hypothetical protein
METAIINQTIKGCNLLNFISAKIDQPDKFFHVIIKPVEVQGFTKPMKKGRWAKVAEEIGSKNVLNKEQSQYLREISREFRDNFAFRKPLDFNRFGNIDE